MSKLRELPSRNHHSNYKFEFELHKQAYFNMIRSKLQRNIRFKLNKEIILFNKFKKKVFTNNSLMPLFGNVRRLCRWIKFHVPSKLYPEQSHNAPNPKASSMYCKARHLRWYFSPFYSLQNFLCGKFCNFSTVFIRSKLSIYYWHQRMRNWHQTILQPNPNFRWISFNNNIFTLLPIAENSPRLRNDGVTQPYFPRIKSAESNPECLASMV